MTTPVQPADKRSAVTSQPQVSVDFQELDMLLERLQQDPTQASNPDFVQQVSSILSKLASDYNSAQPWEKEQYGMAILDLQAAGLITISDGNISPSSDIQGALQNLAAGPNASFLDMTISDIGMAESNNGTINQSSALDKDTKVLVTLLNRLSANPSLANSPDFANEFNTVLNQFTYDYDDAQPWQQKEYGMVILDLQAAGLVSGSPGNIKVSGNVGQILQNLSNPLNKPFLNKIIAEMDIASMDGIGIRGGGPQSSMAKEDLKVFGELMIELEAAPALGTSPLFLKEATEVLNNFTADYSNASSEEQQALAPVVSALKKDGLIIENGSGLRVASTAPIAITALSQNKQELSTLVKTIAGVFAPSNIEAAFEAPAPRA